MYQQARDQVSEDGRLREAEMAEPGKNVKNPETPRLSARQEKALRALLVSSSVEARRKRLGAASGAFEAGSPTTKASRTPTGKRGGR
jgi:hypothetical protein